MEDPDELLTPYVTPGMLVVEPGSGMGIFTLPRARGVGSGRVVAVDIQTKMLNVLRRRAQKAGSLLQRIETRFAASDPLGVQSLNGQVDFVGAVAVVYEPLSVETLSREPRQLLNQTDDFCRASPPVT